MFSASEYIRTLTDVMVSMGGAYLPSGFDAKDVSERLGHAGITLTLDTYAHVLPGMQKKATERLESLLFG